VSRYGIDYYLASYYGSDNPVQYDATPFTAAPNGYGSIQLNWTDPNGDWSRLKIVRNSYGYPVDAFDGITVLEVYHDSDPIKYTDTYNLVPGAFYYYSIYVYSTVQYRWLNAGNAIGVSVKNFANSDKMYNYLPEVYKITQPYSATSDFENDDLYNFLRLFGFELDYEQTLTELLIDRYNVEKVSGSLIPSMLNQFGFNYEPEIGYQQSRVLLRNSIKFLQKKGSADGLREYIKAFSSYAVPAPITGTPNPSIDGLVVGHNKMLDYNDSSFEESTGRWHPNYTSGAYATDVTVSKLSNTTATSISLTGNVATLTIGSHGFAVGNKVVVSNCPMPLFNTPLASVAITAVTATSISYALTGTDTAAFSGLNPATGTYTIVELDPTPWHEPTSPYSFPNKRVSILSIKNATGSAATLNIYCGQVTSIENGIPVDAGTTYTFSVYTAKSTTARNVTAKINWYNRFGIFLSTSSGSAVSNNTATFSASYRPYVSAAAPTGAYYAVPQISVASAAASSSNEYHYFDCAQFEASASVTDFDDARQVHITVRATRINELLNPEIAYNGTNYAPWSFTNAGTVTVDNTTASADIIQYSITNIQNVSGTATITLGHNHEFKVGDSIYIKSLTAAVTSTTPYLGVHVVTAVTALTVSFTVVAPNETSMTATGTMYFNGNGIRIYPGTDPVTIKSYTTNADYCGIYYPETSYTFSIYAKLYTDGLSVSTLTPKIKWYDASKVLISTSTGTPYTVTTSWGRLYVTATAPSNAAYASVEVEWDRTTAATQDEISFDMALFENTAFVLDYFDGSKGPAESGSLFWENSNVNYGRSHLYRNRVATENRLIHGGIQSYLPLGSTFALYLAQPQT
jgi:hypothetical protein